MRRVFVLVGLLPGSWGFLPGHHAPQAALYRSPGALSDAPLQLTSCPLRRRQLLAAWASDVSEETRGGNSSTIAAAAISSTVTITPDSSSPSGDEQFPLRRGGGEEGWQQGGGKGSWAGNNKGFVREVPLPLNEEWEIFNFASLAEDKSRTYTLEELLTLIDQATEWLKGTGCAIAMQRLSTAVMSKPPEVRRLVTSDARFRRLVDRIYVQVPHLTPRSYSMIMFSISKLDYNPGKAFLDACRDGAQVKLRNPGGFDPRSLSNLIMGFTKIGYDPGQEFLVEFSEVVMDQMMEFQPVGFMTVIHAFGKMGFHPGDSFLRVFTACAKRKLVDFKPLELSGTLQGLATLRYVPSDDFMTLYLDCIEAKLDKLNWLDLPNCMTALSKMLYVPSDEFMRKFVKRAREELHAFNAQALSNFIFGLFKLKYDPGPAFMEAFFSACMTKLDRFTPTGCCSMLYSIARMGYHPGEAFLEDLERYTAAKLHAFQRAEVWKIAHGLAGIYYRPGRHFMEAFWKAIARDTASLTVKDASLILWSLAVLDMGRAYVESLTELVNVVASLVERHQFECQFNEYRTRATGNEPAVVKYRQLRQALTYLETLDNDKLRPATDRLSKAVLEAWQARGGGTEDCLRVMPSFYTFVMSMFQNAGAIVNSGVLKDAFNLEIMLFPWTDAGRPLPGQKPLVILLEGRGHYFTNRPTQMTGDARFRYDMVKHMQKDRFRDVLRITVWDWQTAKGMRAKVAMIRDLLKAHGHNLADYLPPDATLSGVPLDIWTYGEEEEGWGEMVVVDEEEKRLRRGIEGALEVDLGEGEASPPPTLKPRGSSSGKGGGAATPSSPRMMMQQQQQATSPPPPPPPRSPVPRDRRPR